MSYEGLNIRAVPFSDPEPIEGGWWRTVWCLQTDQRFDLDDYAIQPPPPELIVTRILVTVVPNDDLSELRVVVTSDDDRNPHHLVFVSLLLGSIAKCTGGVLVINGVKDHPVLDLAQEGRES